MAANDKPDEQAQQQPQPERWIADNFEGSVVVHDVDGDSVTLVAGDQIPPGHEDKVYPNIPTTTSKPRSARIRELDQELGGGPSVHGAAGIEYAEQEQYDPGQHTVVEVIAYLEAHPEDVQQVLELERAGRGRRSLFEKFGG